MSGHKKGHKTKLANKTDKTHIKGVACICIAYIRIEKIENKKFSVGEIVHDTE